MGEREGNIQRTDGQEARLHVHTLMQYSLVAVISAAAGDAVALASRLPRPSRPTRRRAAATAASAPSSVLPLPLNSSSTTKRAVPPTIPSIISRLHAIDSHLKYTPTDTAGSSTMSGTIPSSGGSHYRGRSAQRASLLAGYVIIVCVLQRNADKYPTLAQAAEAAWESSAATLSSSS